MLDKIILESFQNRTCTWNSVLGYNKKAFEIEITKKLHDVCLKTSAHDFINSHVYDFKHYVSK